MIYFWAQNFFPAENGLVKPDVVEIRSYISSHWNKLDRHLTVCYWLVTLFQCLLNDPLNDGIT